MDHNVFYRREDWEPGQDDLIPETVVLGHIPSLIAGVCGHPSISLCRMEASTYHYVYRVETAVDVMFLKISKYSMRTEPLRLEYFIYDRLMKSGKSGVKVLAYDFSGKLPFSFLLLSEAPGVCLRTVPFDHPNFRAIIHSLGERMGLVHCLAGELNGFGPLGVGKLQLPYGTFNDWQSYLLCHIDKHLECSIETGLLNLPQSRQAESWFYQLAQQPYDLQERCLLHGDLSSDNVFVNCSDGQVQAIIDWEDVSLGDGVFDIAMFASFYRMHEFLDVFLEGYGAHNKINNRQFLWKFWVYYFRIVLVKSLWVARSERHASSSNNAFAKIQLALKQIPQYV